MPEMVIDVDTTTEWSLPDLRSWRGRHPVPTILVLALAVMVVLTGPTLVRQTAMSLAWQVPTTTRYFWLTGQAVYTLDSPGDGTVLLSAHNLGNQRVVWTLPLRGPLARVYADPGALFGGTIPPVGTDGVVTTIAGTKGVQVFPAVAAPLVYLTDSLIVTVDRDTSVLPPDAATSPNGTDWAHLVTVRDLNTRAVRWSRRLAPGVRWALPGVRPGTAGIVGLPDGADWLVTDTTDGTVESWDLRTGATLARRTVGPLVGRSYVTALPGQVVVGEDGGDGNDQLSAFDPDTLAPMWRLDPPLANAEPVACAPELCLVTNRAIWIVHPQTGYVIAQINGTELRPGPPGAAVVAPFGLNTSVMMTADGADTAIEGIWRVVDATAYEPAAVVVQVHELGRADIGLLDVRRATVDRLGQVTQWSAYYACLAVRQTVACDDGNVISVWRLATD